MYLDKEQKIFALIKKIFSFKIKISHILALLTGISAALYAADISIPNTFKEGELISASKMNANFQALLDKVNELDSQIDGAPAGAIIPFGGSKDRVPAGWLLCDGSEYDKNNYSELYEAIGTNWGGNGTPMFRVPDLRGQFLRGVDDGAGVDPDSAERTARYSGGNSGDLVGSFQEDEVVSHQHNYIDRYHYVSGTLEDAQNATARKYVYGSFNEHKSTDTFGGNETRPKNVSVNYIIKY